MRKILYSAMIIGVAGLMLGAGTFAYFTDTDTVTGNTFTAGKLDLKLKGTSNPTWGDSASGIITISNLAPGVETGAYYLKFKNDGTIVGKVRVCISYSENDFTPESGEFQGIDVGATAFAKHLAITYADVDGGSDVTSWWVSQIADNLHGGSVSDAITAGEVITIGVTNYPTIYGLSQICLYFWDGYTTQIDIPWNPGDVHTENLKFTLDPAVGNNYQFDGISITLSATMTQYVNTGWT